MVLLERLGLTREPKVVGRRESWGAEAEAESLNREEEEKETKKSEE